MAFSALQFVAPPVVMGSSTTEELVVLTTSGRLFHFANINTALLKVNNNEDDNSRT